MKRQVFAFPAALAVAAFCSMTAQADNLPSPCGMGQTGEGVNCMYLVATGNTYDAVTGNRSLAGAGSAVEVDVWIDFGVTAAQGGGFDLTFDTALVSSAVWTWDDQMVGFNAITLSGSPGASGWEGIQFDDFAGNGFGGPTGTRPGFLRVGTLSLTFNQSALAVVDIAQPYTDATFPNCFAPGAFSGEEGCLPTDFYSIELEVAGTLDSDADGVADDSDNCTLVANADQHDSNADGFGNYCDADITGAGGVEDCFVNFLDLQAVKDAFFSTPVSPVWNPDADFDNSGAVNFADLQILKNQIFGPPGPSGLAVCP